MNSRARLDVAHPPPQPTPQPPQVRKKGMSHTIIFFSPNVVIKCIMYYANKMWLEFLSLYLLCRSMIIDGYRYVFQSY